MVMDCFPIIWICLKFARTVLSGVGSGVDREQVHSQKDYRGADDDHDPGDLAENKESQERTEHGFQKSSYGVDRGCSA